MTVKLEAEVLRKAWTKEEIAIQIDIAGAGSGI